MTDITHSDIRRAEIINACRQLYLTRNFKDISIKEISHLTSFSRPSIYNYFTSLESIFLEIFRQEYVCWCDDMDEILKNNTTLSVTVFADKLAQTLQRRAVLLKLLSMNLYDLEENCTLDELIAFKREYKRALNTVERLLNTYFPEMGSNDTEQFIFCFFPFLFGLYPYTNVTQKQSDAMVVAGARFPQKKDVYGFAYQTILTLLHGIMPVANNTQKE
ncbi:MAG: TetR/AcrR family transcriptional regulator [Muribaculaceae bacterium]|nr:TetR/AcrR family transcriptional regulator [Muribaculaceae bacterium]